MPRDYKNAPRSNRKRNTGKRKKSNLPGWIWIAGILVIGIAIGLAGPRLFGIAQQGLKQVAPAIPTPTDRPTDKPDKSAATQSEPDEPRFDFYKMLPKFQVVIPEQDKSVESDTSSRPVEKPGDYVLQVASFRHYNEADAMQARLALLGLEAHIQQVEIGDGETWNRVRIGPIHNLARLNRTRKTLAEQKIEPLLIRVDGR